MTTTIIICATWCAYQQLRADIYFPQLVVGGVGRGLCVDVSRVHDFHGNAANASLNGTLRHADINQVLSHRAQEKIVKYRAGYAALDVRRAFIPAVVSTSGRIHGDLLRLLYLLADNKTKRHFRDRHEAIDEDSEAYCWRRSGFFWRMRASLGLACAQATTLAVQVFGKGNQGGAAPGSLATGERGQRRVNGCWWAAGEGTASR